jgi:hypothetical protein
MLIGSGDDSDHAWLFRRIKQTNRVQVIGPMDIATCDGGESGRTPISTDDRIARCHGSDVASSGSDG